ncbi:hypothetical protein R5H30_04100 [Sulfitobacter sp. D35]|uniref:hypothetical protein n=1 Tax=Sulfitobacter sp. D35 TaxID=3083252 RepID=UPI00296F6F87|nr:hypothetical protein [Sulfitobacter sp. D35]MDW4497153.1 hypothetical protein [Sulfitobacter sp. D35]
MNRRRTEAPSSNLADVVRRLGSPPQHLADERGSLPASSRAKIDCLLREIDETILPRRITLTSGAKVVATLFAGNRRLYQLRPEDDPSRAISRENSDIASLAAAFSQAVGQATSVSVEALGENGPECQSVDSCSVSSLRAELETGEEICAFEALVLALDPLTLAKVDWHRGGDAQAFRGADTWRHILEYCARNLHEGGKPVGSGRGTFDREVKGIAVPIDEAHAIVAGTSEGQGFVCVVPRSEGLRAISTWQTSR